MPDENARPPHSGTAALIASDKVQGTRVFGADGAKIGSVHSVMIGKRSGQVVYVVLSTGGFLGLGQAYHPLPWSALHYDEHKDGYVLQISSEMLAGGPSYRPDTAPDFDARYGGRIDDYYKIPAGTISL